MLSRITGLRERFLDPFALFLLALAVRALPWPTLLTEPGRLPTGTDEYYHLRRIWYSVVNFPEVLQFDSYLNFPHGAKVVWPPLFDWVVAGVARLTVGVDQAAVEHVAIWAPSVLGAATVVVAYRIALRHFGRRAALLVGLLLAVLPAAYPYTQLGRVDHHAAVSFATACLLAAAMRFLSEEGRAASAGVTVAPLGLAMGTVLLLWPGALLHVALAQIFLVASLLLEPTGSRAVAVARRLAVVHGIACVLVIPFAAGQHWERFGSFTPLVLSNFQPAWFGAGAATFALLALLWRRSRLGGDRGIRILSALALGLLGLGAAIALLPGLADALDYARGWFGKEEDFQTHVLELKSLVWDREGLRTGKIVGFFSPLGFGFPLILAALCYRALRERRDAGTWLLIGWAAAFCAAAAAQFRFLNSFSVVYAITLGVFLDWAFAEAQRRGAGRPSWRRGTALAAALVAVLFLWPLPRFYAPYLSEWVGTEERQAARPRGLAARSATMSTVARWLAAHSPATSGYLGGGRHPEYGILASWGDGHLLRYLAERPMVQDNFGVYGGRENYDLSEAYFSAESEEEAISILERLGVRYVVSKIRGSGHGGRYSATSMVIRLSHLRGSEGTVREDLDTEIVEVPALARHRLLFETKALWVPERVSPRSEAANAVRIFEVVAGARVVGAAAPGALVSARLRLRPAGGDRFTYRSRTRAGDDGRYHLHLPYPNQPFNADLEVADHYDLMSLGRRGRLLLSEEAIRSGATVPGPRLVKCSAAEEGSCL